MSQRPGAPSNSRGDEESNFPAQIYASPADPTQTFYADPPAPYQISAELFDFSDFVLDNLQPLVNSAKPFGKDSPVIDATQRRSSTQPIYTAMGNIKTLHGCAENHAEASLSGSRGMESHMAHSYFKNPPEAHAADSESPCPMESAVIHMRHASEPAQTSISKYEQYAGRFNSSTQASHFRKTATRFNREPYRYPDSDDTISEIERDRAVHVQRIYNAMTSGEAARDNKGSIAMKRWVHGAYYDSSLVEAYAHKVFDILLVQVKEGFRGFVHNDYGSSDHKGEIEDRDMNCEARLDSIIRALEEEKTICEDVMNSACQIRMFVNAPRSYANRKCQNRIGNSKRGRPKDSNTRETSSKSRRVRAQSATRARPHQSVANALPSTRSSRSNRITPTAQPRATPAQVAPADPMFSPHQASYVASVPVIPSMHSAPSYDFASSVPLVDQLWNWSEDQQGIIGANLFADFPEAATLDGRQDSADPPPHMDFQEFWQNQQGVQELQFPQASESSQMQSGNRPL